MPETRKKIANTEEEISEEALIKRLSANLKKSHAARTAALFKDGDEVTSHVKQEAARAALDPNMLQATP
jgi:hypothetical protein